MAVRCAGMLPEKGFLLLASDEQVMANRDVVALSNTWTSMYI